MNNTFTYHSLSGLLTKRYVQNDISYNPELNISGSLFIQYEGDSLVLYEMEVSSIGSNNGKIYEMRTGLSIFRENANAIKSDFKTNFFEMSRRFWVHYPFIANSLMMIVLITVNIRTKFLRKLNILSKYQSKKKIH